MKKLGYISIRRYIGSRNHSRCSLVPAVVSTSALDLPDQLRLNPATAHALHHCEMFEVVMRLEKGITSEELDEDAANAPDIARVAPSQVEDDLRGSVVPCGNDRGVVFVVKGCGSKINQSDLGVQQDSPLASDALHRCGRRRDVAVVGEGLI